MARNTGSLQAKSLARLNTIVYPNGMAELRSKTEMWEGIRRAREPAYLYAGKGHTEIEEGIEAEMMSEIVAGICIVWKPFCKETRCR